jgi:hypothetical protein
MDTLTPLSTGAPLPALTLPDLEGRPQPVTFAPGQIGVICFWSAECPWSQRADEALWNYRLVWGDRVQVVWIAANVNERDSECRAAAATRGLPDVRRDPQGAAVAALGAQTTPHVFIFDAAGSLRYQGAFDDVTFRRREPTRHYVQEAVAALLAGETPDPASTPAYGCTIIAAD